jgi:hypothetical protein
MLFARATWCLVVNQYTIEGWELERHEVLLRRARVLGGFLDGPNGRRVRIVRQEFPYDIGFWSNIIQGMGTSNVRVMHHRSSMLANQLPDCSLVLALRRLARLRKWVILGDQWIRR